jgi:hypothetical protein
VAGELEVRREKGYGPALPIAWTYLGLGETDAALDCLETALAEHDPFLGSAMVFPGYDAIRDQARFRRLAHQINFRPSGLPDHFRLVRQPCAISEMSQRLHTLRFYGSCTNI